MTDQPQPAQETPRLIEHLRDLRRRGPDAYMSARTIEDIEDELARLRADLEQCRRTVRRYVQDAQHQHHCRHWRGQGECTCGLFAVLIAIGPEPGSARG